MPGCIIRRTEEQGRAIFGLQGAFDGTGAWDLAGRLAGERLGRVLLDFSQVNEFADYAVAVLSHALQPSYGRSVQIIGLRQHQARLLKYFGIDVSPAAPRLDDAQVGISELAVRAQA